MGSLPWHHFKISAVWISIVEERSISLHHAHRLLNQQTNAFGCFLVVFCLLLFVFVCFGLLFVFIRFLFDFVLFFVFVCVCCLFVVVCFLVCFFFVARFLIVFVCVPM